MTIIKKFSFIFTPHLSPMFRGILSTIYIDLNKGVNIKKIEIMYTNKTMLETAQEYGVAYFDMATYLVEMGAAIPFGKQLLARTTVCKFFTITEASQFNKLLSPEEPTSHVWVKHNMTDKCELMKLRRQLSIGR